MIPSGGEAVKVVRDTFLFIVTLPLTPGELYNICFGRQTVETFSILIFLT